MAIEPTYKTINTSYRKYMGSDQQKIESKLFLEKGETIAKILCAKVVACIPETEILAGEARYTSKVRCEVVYMSEDGRLHSINDMMEFSGKIQDPLFNTLMYALPNSQIIDAQIEGVQSDTITISSIVDTRIDTIANDTVKYLDNAGERIVVRKDKSYYFNMVAKQKSKFKVVEEYETRENMGKLLLATVNICNQEVVCGTNYITIKGSLNLNLNYETDGEQPELKNSTKTFNFKEEIEADGVTPDSVINLILNVKEDEVNVVGNNIDGMTVLKVSVMLCYNYAALNRECIEAITDAFSLDNNINLTAESFYRFKFLGSKDHMHTVSSTAMIEGDDRQIESIEADCGGAAFVANSYCIENYAIAEGIVHANIVYYTFNEAQELMYDSLAVQIPYSMEIPCNNASEDSTAMVVVAVRDMQVRRKRSKEVELQVELCAFAQIYENEQEIVLNTIEVINKSTEDDVSLKMYAINKDNTLWDVCKRVNAEPETIIKQNPNLTFPLAEDNIIIVYKPKEEEY
ncbi:MAG: DUF3794 domain-containing protein [Clostridia bacterium]|nr:DUF3794 domain-containing protein [Clostridia bacterium]